MRRTVPSRHHSPGAPSPWIGGRAGRSEEQTSVLLVDPDEDSRSIYAALLRHHGFLVLEAEDGAQGILLARLERPDVIATELFVPSASGWELPELLKGDLRTARIPILALTAYAFEADEQRAWSAGCDGFLAKPCEPARMWKRCSGWLRLPTIGDDGPLPRRLEG